VKCFLFLLKESWWKFSSMFEDVRYGLDGGVFPRVIIEEDRWKLGNPTFMFSGDLTEEVLLYSLI